MKRIAQFEKVSIGQFRQGWLETFYPDGRYDEAVLTGISEVYNNIILPRRATRGSAGYDFFSPLTFTLEPGHGVRIPTGIRVRIDEGWVLQCYPRSSLGFKYRLQLDNTVGIIDSDYYGAANEGHIFCKLTNDSRDVKTVTIEAGIGFMQGIFLEYGITVDDASEQIRNGGIGSTTVINNK